MQRTWQKRRAGTPGGGLLAGEPQSFGPFTLSAGQQFFRSALSVGFTNIKPLVPGHVLVIPRRVVPTYAELSEAEEADLWESVVQVMELVGAALGPPRFEIGMQDGPLAGQSVPHVHVHVLPFEEAAQG